MYYLKHVSLGFFYNLNLANLTIIHIKSKTNVLSSTLFSCCRKISQRHYFLFQLICKERRFPHGSCVFSHLFRICTVCAYVILTCMKKVTCFFLRGWFWAGLSIIKMLTFYSSRKCCYYDSCLQTPLFRKTDLEIHRFSI